MNKHLHRLVFSLRLGLRVAAPETARSRGKAASGGQKPVERVLLVTAAAFGLSAPLAPAAFAQTRPPVTFAGQLPAPAMSLPQPFTSLMRDPAGRGFATPVQGSSAMGWQVNGKTATFNQGSVEKVLLNWQSFDIAEGYTVRFIQDKDLGKYVTALNRVWSDRPSIIQGSLLADREVILQNAEGVYFGRTARVSAGKFVASTLAVSDATFNRGIRNVIDANPVFTTAGTDYKPTNLNGAVSLEAGAEITTAAGGDVLLVAPRIVNRGRIDTPSGQAVLAAGDKVYLMSSSDPAQRGLIVAVDPVKLAGSDTVDATLGSVENAATGSFKTVGGETVPDSTPDSTAGLVKKLNEIRADSGTVNLVGLSVQQNGRINATTAVKGANGAIYLQAMVSTTPLLAAGVDGASRRGLTIEAGSAAQVASQLGTVQIGAGSTTAVLPDGGGATQLDAEVFNPSLIQIDGSAIVVGAGASIVAPAGRVSLRAAQRADNNLIFDSEGVIAGGDGSRIAVAPGATISTAGLQDVPIDGARNQGALRLFRIELADAPVQRSGPLYRSQVLFDARDATKITAANVSGAAAASGRTAGERSTAGGTLSLQSAGALLLGEGSALDVSGGSVRYSQALISNTLLAQSGRAVTFRAALADTTVDAVLSNAQQTVAPAYTEGAAGGALLLSGRQIALAGQVAGTVTLGERQRSGMSSPATPSRLSIGASDGNTYDLDTLALLPDARTAISPPVWSEPLQPELPGLSTRMDLSLVKVAAGGFGSLIVRAATVVQPDHGVLDLGAGGTLDAQARTISINGAFTAAGGRISLVTPTAAADAEQTGVGDIRLSGSTRLDVAGVWTNDSAGAGQAAATPIANNGGSITVRSAHSLLADAGAELDVSGGARLGPGGALSQGKAGAMALSTGTAIFLNPRLSLQGVTLRAFDFGAGGTLRLGTPALRLGAAPLGNPGLGGFALDDGFFSDSGFGDIAVSAFGDVRVVSGTQLAPRLLNWQFADGYRFELSGRLTSAVATPQRIDARLAAPGAVSLSLTAARPLLGGGGSVTVERGAGITLDPGGSLTLSATRGVDVGASGGGPGLPSLLSAPGGAINLAITGRRGGTSTDDPDGFIGSQAIWLGPRAELSVSGTAQLRRETGTPALVQFGADAARSTPADQRVVGTVFGGGSITLNAARGYVVADPGSSLALDGFAAELNVPGQLSPQRVAKPAGTLTVSSPEGFVLESRLTAQAPRDAAGRALADAGKLNLLLAVTGVQGRTDTTSHPFPSGPRVLSVGDHDGLLRASGAVLGEDLSASLGNGTGFVRKSLLQGAGFADVQLAAGDRISFDMNLSLDVPLGIALDSPAIAAAPGSQVTLNTTYARLGDASGGRLSAADSSARRDASDAAPTQFSVTAQTIDVFGNTGLQGFSTVNLSATASEQGEIRFSAANPDFGRLETLQRQLSFAGLLQLTAGQVFVTSATQYRLAGLAAAGLDDAGSRLVVRGLAQGAPSQQPLSALASLTVNATEIDQGGVLRQPFGRISLNAERSLQLGDGSITAASGAGATVLFGSTENLADWSVNQPGSFAGPILNGKGVELGASRLLTSSSAVVSAAGGGVLQASEFFPGVGGSSNYLERPGLYAVLPDVASTKGLNIRGGIVDAQQAGLQLVVTLPGSGLAPGRYSLLPASYALLAPALQSGAYIVSLASDQGRTTLRAPLVQDDGSVVVTGYFTTAGSVNVGAPGQRFVVEPAATFQAKGDVRVTDVSQLLASRAARLGQERPILPSDGGTVKVTQTGSSTSFWQAQIKLSAAGSQAGVLDMAATRIALVDAADKTPAGALAVKVETLSDSGAGSVLLGGLRRQVNDTGGGTTAAAWAIDSSGTQFLTVDIGNATLRTEELLLAASNSITLAPGTRVASTATATLGPRALALQGDGAFLAVSANALTVQRTAASLSAGDLRIGAGSSLSGTQLDLDATGQLQIDSSARLDAQALTIGAQRLVLGDGVATDSSATVLSGGLLAAVRRVPDLSLRGYSGIDFAGRQDWAARPTSSVEQPDPAPTAVLKRLVLDTASLRGVPAADGTPAHTDIAAEDLVLRNSGAGAAPTVADGQGRLLLQALPPLRYGHTGGITLGPGNLALGFDIATLRSNGDVVLQGTGSTRAQGALTLSAARLTAATGAEQALEAAGVLRLDNAAGARTLGERVGQGASVLLSADTVQQDGRVDLPGGVFAMQALGVATGQAAIRFGVGSITSVAGFAMTGSEGFTAYGAAGEIRAVAAAGRIEMWGLLDVSAAPAPDGGAGLGDAGSITLSAPGGGGLLSLASPDPAAPGGRIAGRAGGGVGDLGGRLVVDVDAMPSADALATTALAGGMTQELALRVRSGDLALNQAVKAQRISIAADAGILAVGTAATGPVALNADAAAGGVVQLTAGGNLVLGPQATVSARSAADGAPGGDVLLASANGRVAISDRAFVDASGTREQDGRIVLRARRGPDNASVQIDAVNTGRLKAGDVSIEAVRVYEGIDAVTSIDTGASGALAQSAVRADNDAFMAGKSGVLAALGVSEAEASSGRVRLRAGVEVRATGDLTINQDWLFSGTAGNPNRDRPGGDAGFLTLRAAGDIVLNASLSDGFTPGGLLNSNPRSWSYRVVAGADSEAANPLTVRTTKPVGVNGGDLSIGPGVVVRTGAGSVDLVARRDLFFVSADEGTAVGAAYVAGRALSASAAPNPGLFSGFTAKPVFSEGGGRLNVFAGRDVVAPEATQLIGNWLWRSALLSSVPGQTGQYASVGQLAWWTQFDRFAQTLGSFGGGNLNVRAGRDVLNLQAVAPTQGWADDRTAAAAQVVVVGGGEVTVNAGRDVLGGQFLAGRGVGRLNALGSVGAMPANATVTVPLLGLMGGRWLVTARRAVSLGSVFNPTAVPAAAGDFRDTVSGYFYTWGADASLSVVANAGGINLGLNAVDDSAAVALGLEPDLPNASVTFGVLPPSLIATAAGGDLSVSGGGLMFPASNGQLRLWSAGQIAIGGGSQLVMADSNPNQWPQGRTPSSPRSNPLVQSLIPDTLSDSLPLTGLHAGDRELARIHAEGALNIQGGSATTSTLLLPKAATLVAGSDVVQLSVRVQNLEPTDLTKVTAGRNYLAGAFGRVEIAGPGSLEIDAAGSVELGNSSGISSSGNLRNAGLPAQGASIAITAASRGTTNLQVLTSTYLAAPPQGGNPRYQTYRDLLTAQVRLALTSPGLDFDRAWAAFQAFPARAQADFAQQVLAAEFGAVYLVAPAPDTGQVTSTLQTAFERRKADILKAGGSALAAGGGLTLPGRDTLRGDALAAYLAELRALGFASLDLNSTVAARVASLGQLRQGWRDRVAASLGSSAAELDALLTRSPQDPRALRYGSELANFSGDTFQSYRSQAFATEVSSAAAAASNFGLKALPMRLALFDQGFAVAELAGFGNFTPSALWPGATPLLTYSGAMDMTQSSVLTRRGGDIRLVNAGGAITVGLKDKGSAARGTPTGVIALGGGDVFGFAKDDFQVNTQRAFIVGEGDMNIWSSLGDIDSGRGANTAVAAPPLAARRSVDGVVFEVTATTTGSGLGILADAQGRRSGRIGLYPAFGEILALDAFIRAPSVVLGSTIKGADNLVSGSVGGAAAAVSPPAVAVAPPAASNDSKTAAAAAAGAGAQTRQRNALLTVELLGLGAGEAEPCDEKQRLAGECRQPPR